MSPARQAILVVDLGFGDSGKGTITDFLARQGARWVVRFNGGAQAGHNVVTPDGRHHTFAQFGSGTFVKGVRTFLSRFTVVHPTALLVEARHLARAGVPDALDRLAVSRSALVITPYHQAANRLREWARGDGRLGTCGVGFGETVGDSLARPDLAIRAGDLLDPYGLEARLTRVRDAKRAELREAFEAFRGFEEVERARAVFESDQLVASWIEIVAPLRRPGLVVGDDSLGQVLAASGTVVFEGAQGVLLDEWRGFHPHTTWSNCTFENAQTLLCEHGFDGDVMRLGLVRSYLTRHGAGPFPSEDRQLTPTCPEPHNGPGGWQGAFRVGWLDLPLLRYALACCGGADALAVTHLDRVMTDPAWQVVESYHFAGGADPTLFEIAAEAPSHAVGIRLGPAHDLEHQAQLTRALELAHPTCRSIDRGEAPAEMFLRLLEAEAGTPVRLTSAGPDARAKAWRLAPRAAPHMPVEEPLVEAPELPLLDAVPQTQLPLATSQGRPSQSALDAQGLAVLHC